MQSYYQNRQLPQPVIPNLPPAHLLKGQAALVTGANSGIGRAITLALGRAGADVVIYIVGSTIYVDGGMTLYPGFETGG